VFRKAAVEYEQEFSFGISTGTGTNSAELPMVKCYKKSGEDTQSFSGPFEDGPFESFVKEASVRTLTQPNPTPHLRTLGLTQHSGPILPIYFLTITSDFSV
jgi:hypothetical protein